MSQQQLDRNIIEDLIHAKNIADLTFDELLTFFRSEEGMTEYLPDGSFAIDCRGKDRIIFHPGRAKRPQDNIPVSSNTSHVEPECMVCKGQITRIIDLFPLSQGNTIINKNLYPSLFPLTGASDLNERAFGFHFLQWTSTSHHLDWHNMPLGDATKVMNRLALLEKKLLSFKKFIPRPHNGVCDVLEEAVDEPTVAIIKNFGRLVGGSISHGHQQILLSNLISRRQLEDLNFLRKTGTLYSSYMLQQTPSELIIKDYGNALLVVPFTMKRPYDMLLLMKNTSRQFIHQLERGEIESVAQAWGDTIRAIRQLLPELGRPIAYNIVTHNGAGAGLYFEFLPYTQELGGFEQLGLYVCQSKPSLAAERLRTLVNI